MERIDRSTLQIVVKSQADRRALNDVEKQLGETTASVNKLQKEFDKLNKKEPNNKNSKKYTEWKKQIDGVSESLANEKARLADLEKQKNKMINQMGVEKLTLSEVRNEMKQYKMLLDNLDPKSDEYKKTLDYYQKLKARLAEVNGTLRETKSSLQKFAEGFNHIGFAITNALAIKDRIVQWADQYVQSFAKMDEAMTDAMKYTGQTKAEVEHMNEAFQKMTTRTAREELNALAGAAGRLGITAERDIIGFVDAADKINVALGDDLGEGAIDQIGKLTMVFGEDKTKGLNGAMLATGSAINVLGANSSANTGFITEFTSAMAGMAVNAKISQTDIMGYASALSQAGIEGQTASGVFAQMITKMFTDPAKFARAARLDVKQFTDLLKTDANAAILQFLNGLKQNGGFDSLAPALKSLSMQGTQAVPVISSLINKMDELKKAQTDARQAYDEGTSIIDEFNNANSSAAAKLDIAKKSMNDVATELGQKLMPIVEGSINATTTLLKIMTPLVSAVMSCAPAIIKLTVAIVAYNVATKAASIGTTGLANAIRTAWTATKGWFATLMSNPIGLAAAAVTLLATEVYSYISRAREAAKIQGQMNEAMREAKKEAADERTELEQLTEKIRSNTTSEEDRRKALEQLNGKLAEMHLGNLSKEDVLTGNLTATLDEYNRRLETRIRLEKLQQQQKDLLSQKIDIEEGGYKDDISFLDRFNQGVAGVGQVLISGHTQGIGQAWDQATGQMEESFKQRALRPVLEGLESVEQKIADIRNQENQIHHIGNVVITPNRPTVPDDSPSGSNTSDSTSKKNKKDNHLQQLREQLREQEALLKAQHQEDMTSLQMEWEDKLTTDEEYHRKRFAYEEEYLDNLAQLRMKYGASEADRQEVANMQLEAIAREASRRHQQQLEEQRKQQEQERRELERNRLSQEGNNEYMQQVEWQGQSFDRMRQLNEEYLQQNLISYQQYQDNLTRIAQEQTDQRQQLQQAAIDATQQLLNSASSFFSAMQSRETAEVDAKYKRMIAAAKKQGKDTSKLEEQQEQEKAAIQKKYADRNFQIQVLQIIGNTAQGISKTIAELGMPWAVPFVAMAAAAGAMQLASANAAKEQAAGLYTGGYSDDYLRSSASGGSPAGVQGYTKKGDPRKQAGVIPVHQNEFVANHRAVANPSVRPVLDVIDRHQRLGDIQLLNATRLLEEAYGQGRYRGGFSAGTGSAGTQGGLPAATSDAADQLLPVLERIADNTSRSLTVRRLREEIAHEEHLERNARR